MNTSKDDSSNASKTSASSDELTKTPIDKLSDSHRAIASDWIARAMTGIKEMHESEPARREVADKLF
ncbi:uncharacterized protein BCN122_III0441 [Burkholderia cenocepacia]|nr:uncharacterized protein BCN122_III0441 [Burkholderia cenocepacia]